MGHLLIPTIEGCRRLPDGVTAEQYRSETAAMLQRICNRKAGMTRSMALRSQERDSKPRNPRPGATTPGHP